MAIGEVLLFSGIGIYVALKLWKNNKEIQDKNRQINALICKNTEEQIRDRINSDEAHSIRTFLSINLLKNSSQTDWVVQGNEVIKFIHSYDREYELFFSIDCHYDESINKPVINNPAIILNQTIPKLSNEKCLIKTIGKNSSFKMDCEIISKEENPKLIDTTYINLYEEKGFEYLLQCLQYGHDIYLEVSGTHPEGKFIFKLELTNNQNFSETINHLLSETVPY